MVLGAYLAVGGQALHLPQVWLAALVVALVVAFGFVINDYADRELDRLSKPWRPIPQGSVTPGTAFWLACVIALLVVGSSWLFDPARRVLVLTNLSLTALYALQLKRTVLVGNVAIACLNSSVLLFGGLTVGSVPPVLWAACWMSFCYSVAQEIIYTAEDYVGDREGGIVTTAVFFGIAGALRLARVLLILTVLAGLWLALVAEANLFWVLALVLCTLLPIAVLLLPLTWRSDATSVGRASRLIRLIRLSSIVPLLFLPG
jgi:4-hydroxybenzoate polyprenyltransferase